MFKGAAKKYLAKMSAESLSQCLCVVSFLGFTLKLYSYRPGFIGEIGRVLRNSGVGMVLIMVGFKILHI